MIRAKTLVASVVILGTGLTYLALNSRHDGFVPATSVASPTGTALPSVADTALTPAHAIARLPKLAPLETATSFETAPLAPTVVEIEVVSNTPNTDDDATPRGTTPQSPELFHQSVTATPTAQDDAHSATTERASAKIAIGIPLPVRLPQEYQIVRARQFARTNAAPDASTEDYESGLLHDPAVPNIQSREALRLQRLKRAQRLERNRRRAAMRRKLQSAKAKNVIASTDGSLAASKPRRHRKPFASNHN